MHKVIVERARPGSRYHFGKGDPLRKLSSEELPARESMKRRHADRRHFNENLKPLQRWLERQVGRPWDKVYSEACEVIRPTSTVKNHIKIHLLQFVDRNVTLIDGVPHSMGPWWGTGFAELRDREIYIDPESGLLRCHRRRQSARRPALPEVARVIREEPIHGFIDTKELKLSLAADERGVRRWLYRKLRGLWSLVEEYELHRLDTAGRPKTQVRVVPYDPARHVRIRSRQLNHRELRELDLRND